MKVSAERYERRLVDALSEATGAEVGEAFEVLALGAAPQGELWRGPSVRQSDAELELRWRGERVRLRPRGGVERRQLEACGGVLASTFMRVWWRSLWEEGAERLGELRLPELSAARRAQLAALFRRYRANDEDDGAPLGAIDRCVADLYGLPLDLLMAHEEWLSRA